MNSPEKSSTIRNVFQVVEDRLFHSHFLIAVFLLGLFIRLLFMPFSMHVDPRFNGDLLAINESAFSFLHNPLSATTVYPPLAMYTIGLNQYIWNLPLSIQSLLNDPKINITPNIFYILFSTKTLYLLFDLMIFFLWLRFYRNDLYKRRLAGLFWLFNPLVIYDAYIHGQYDLIPIFFVVLSLYFLKERKQGWAAFLLGIGGCYKDFPLFFLLPLVIISAKSWRERLVLFLLGILPYILLKLPFLGQYSARFSDFSSWFSLTSYDLGLGSQVYIFFIFYAILLWVLYQSNANTFEAFWRACFAILLVYYQFSYFDLHYWVWIVPFATIYLVEYPREAKPFYVVIGLLLLPLLAPTPLARFLAPISPRFFLRLPSLMEALNPYLPMLFLTNVVRSLLAGTCFYLAWRLVRGMPATSPETALPTHGPEISA
jgi:hypothetical protein